MKNEKIPRNQDVGKAYTFLLKVMAVILFVHFILFWKKIHNKTCARWFFFLSYFDYKITQAKLID